MCDLLTKISRLNTRHLDKIGKINWLFLLASSRDCDEEDLALFLLRLYDTYSMLVLNILPPFLL